MTTYYANYQGPLLTSAILTDHCKQLHIYNVQPLTPCPLITADEVGVLNVQRCNNREDDYTTLFSFLYGPQQNWRGRLYKFSYVFCPDDIRKTLCLQYNDDSNRKHYTKMTITSLDIILNPPLFMPMDQR